LPRASGAIDVALPGDHAVVDWYPEGDSVLRHTLDACASTGSVATGAVLRWTPRASIGDARCPDGGSGSHLMGTAAGAARRRRGAGELPPTRRAAVLWRFTNDHGQEVRGWIVEPRATVRIRS
jgi:hypothetical protein